MSVSIRLSDELVRQARFSGKIHDRSPPQQIEHWAKIGRIAKENQDLTYKAIREILLGISDVAVGNVEEYEKGSL